MCCQCVFFLLRFQILWPRFWTWDFHIALGNFVPIPETFDTWNCFSSVLHWLTYSYLVLISSHFTNCSFLYLIGMYSPIPCLVSPIVLNRSFLSCSSLWNAYCFVILFCLLFFRLFVAHAQWLANFIVLAQFYTANSSTVTIAVFTHFTQQFTA